MFFGHFLNFGVLLEELQDLLQPIVDDFPNNFFYFHEKPVGRTPKKPQDTLAWRHTKILPMSAFNELCCVYFAVQESHEEFFPLLIVINVCVAIASPREPGPQSPDPEREGRPVSGPMHPASS